MWTDRDTIAAPLSAPGAAAVSLVRISGGLTQGVLKQIVAKAEHVLAKPRTLVLSAIWDGESETSQREELDSALVAFFPAPRSFTGEDCAELNLHGSPYILVRLFEILAELGVRMARPGEFSERAFLNGQIDLSQAEAVADLVAAETSAQAKVAREQLAGRLSAAVSDFGQPLRALVAEIEAWIDFPDEDIEPLSVSQWQAAVSAVQRQITAAIDSFKTGRLYREGAQVVLVGVPNAGKSSLLNALVGENRVIVTPIPGTTRDSIEERISLDGLSVRLWDTAGLVAESDSSRVLDEVERLGIERSWQRTSQAELVVFVFATELEMPAQSELFARAKALNPAILPLINKADLLEPAESLAFSQLIFNLAGAEPLLISASDGSGLEQLRKQVYARLVGGHDQKAPPARGQLLVTNRRHHEALSSAAEALVRAQELLEAKENTAAELVALELRSALGALDQIIGTTSTEDILGLIFSKFCIGK